MIQENDYFTSVDMQDAYFAVSVNLLFRRYLKFFWNGKLLAFVCVPFGMSSAPCLFMKLLKPIFSWFRQQGIRCSYYIDDSLNMDSNCEICACNTMTIVKTLESLGFTINRKKISVGSGTENYFLWFSDRLCSVFWVFFD